MLFLLTSLNSFLYPSASLLPTLKKYIHCNRTDGDQTGISHNSCPQVLHELHFFTFGSSGNKLGNEEDGVAMSYMHLQAVQQEVQPRQPSCSVICFFPYSTPCASDSPLSLILFRLLNARVIRPRVIDTFTSKFNSHLHFQIQPSDT